MCWKRAVEWRLVLDDRGRGEVQSAKQLGVEATTMVDRDLSSAPIGMGITNPIGAGIPAARGTEMRLYPAAQHRFCFIFEWTHLDG